MIFNQLTQSLSSGLNDYAVLNEKLATNKKLLAPSDNPGGMGRAVDYHIRLSQNEQYTKSIEFASAQLDFASTTLQSAQTTISLAMDLLNKRTGAAAADPTTLTADAQMASALKDTLFDLSNQQYGGQYIFSGFKSDTQAYAAGTYDYQGDAGLVNVPVSQGTNVAVNVPGSSAFSYTFGVEGATYTKTINGGLKAHYTQGAGTAISVDIYDATDTTVLDSFTFTNIMQMTDLLSTSITANDTARIAALADPFSKAQAQMQTSITDVGLRITTATNQSTWLSQNTTSLQSALIPIEDADTMEVVAQLKQMETSLAATRDAASRILSQSLLDFLK